MTARLEALRRTAARLELHYSRRIDLVRGRLAGAASPPAPLASGEMSTDEDASRAPRPKALAAARGGPTALEEGQLGDPTKSCIGSLHGLATG